MARNLAMRVAHRGVTVNNLAPGAVFTNRNADVLADPAMRAEGENGIPLRRLGVADDCVGACLLLCSDGGAYITASTIFVDGGWHRR